MLDISDITPSIYHVNVLPNCSRIDKGQLTEECTVDNHEPSLVLVSLWCCFFRACGMMWMWILFAGDSDTGA